jgi:hypothetical protein
MGLVTTGPSVEIPWNSLFLQILPKDPREVMLLRVLKKIDK